MSEFDFDTCLSEKRNKKTKYIITNGSQYICIGEDNKCYLNDDKEKAFKFKTKEKANNLMGKLPKSLKLLSLYIDETFEITDTTDPLTDIDMKYLKKLDINSTVNEIEKILKQTKAYKPILENQVEKYRLAIMDIEHNIEFKKLNIFKIFRCYRMIKAIKKNRLKRRKAKDLIVKIEIISSSEITDFYNGRVAKQLKGLDERKYRPRVLKELFDNDKG